MSNQVFKNKGPEYYLELIEQRNSSLLEDIVKNMPGFLLKDRDFVLKAVNAYGWSLMIFPDFQDDDEIVMAAVQSTGTALKFASDRLRKDDSIIRAALSNYGEAVEFINRDRMGCNNKTCKEIAREQNVEYFVHFTPADNLRSILLVDKCLYSRSDMERKRKSEGRDFVYTDSQRSARAMSDTISLSVTIPNMDMLRAKMRNMTNTFCILRFNADSILEHHCLFTRYNAAAHQFDKDRSGIRMRQRCTCYDFLSFFAGQPANGLARFVQAEILYDDGHGIPASEINSIIFRTEEEASPYRDIVDEAGIELIIDPSYYPAV